MLCNEAMQVDAEPSEHAAPAAFFAWGEYSVCCCAQYSLTTLPLCGLSPNNAIVIQADQSMHSNIM